ncbi:PqiB family protein [Ideonella sp. BN130291]|uniref:PqiB family protein n=1 Tax=Ideonella sp. BN130291 TaxID=3112940 RepID=UPI002E267A79|nr:MlaD family protein [Ideonella sp. BN130291]
MDTPDSSDLPAPQVEARNRLRLSLVWLVPLLAVLLGLGLVVRNWLQTGPDIVIEFRTAEGLEAGKTEVRYKEVAIGKVSRVALSPDRQRVLATVQLDKSAENMAVKDTRFWVVRPRVGTGGVSGLSTLLSGAYIGVDAGVSPEAQKHFVGLEVPPFVLRNEPGRSFVLTAGDLGSLDIGSPVYYRRIRVGRVVGFALDPSLDMLSVQVFIEAPNEKLVTAQSRFWNASGVDLSLGANGLKLNTQSLASVVSGGLAFANAPGTPASAPQAAEGTRFTLFADRDSALAPPDGPPLTVRMVFTQNTRGLAPGAPVDVLGVEVGRITAVNLRHDSGRERFAAEVLAELYPRRLGIRGQPGVPDDDRQLMKLLVERGLRAQMRTANLFTGQMTVALYFPSNEKPASASFDTTADTPTMPTMPSQFGALQPQLMQIVKRLSEVRFDQIGQGVQQTLHSANAAIEQLTPEAQRALADVRKTLQQAERTLGSAEKSLQQLDRNITADDAPLQRNAQQTMDELQRAARALRVLSDYLQRHPEALLRGKPEDLPLKDPYSKP